jgi:hypothetical protein
MPHRMFNFTFMTTLHDSSIHVTRCALHSYSFPLHLLCFALLSHYFYFALSIIIIIITLHRSLPSFVHCCHSHIHQFTFPLIIITLIWHFTLYDFYHVRHDTLIHFHSLSVFMHLFITAFHPAHLHIYSCH